VFLPTANCRLHAYDTLSRTLFFFSPLCFLPMPYLAGMIFRSFVKFMTGLVAVLCFFSCHKKGDFIDEQEVGSGIHYYPVIVNNYFIDTITGKSLDQRDTTFSPGQTIVFEMDYFSKEKIRGLELWAGRSMGDLTQVMDIPYDSSMHSFTKYIDTVLFQYTIPPGTDSSSAWYLESRVVTEKGLRSSLDASLNIQ
jgi:hypothetical protein